MALKIEKLKAALFSGSVGARDTKDWCITAKASGKFLNALFDLINLKLLHLTQSGFRPNHSCETALQMFNKFLEVINNSHIIGMVMLNFRKAFGLIDQTLLLKKLRHFTLSYKTINWFPSYLLDRKQKVVINKIE